VVGVVGQVGEQRLVDVEHPGVAAVVAPARRGARVGGGLPRHEGEVGAVPGAHDVAPHVRGAVGGDGPPRREVVGLRRQPPARAAKVLLVRRRDVRSLLVRLGRRRGGEERGEQEQGPAVALHSRLGARGPSPRAKEEGGDGGRACGGGRHARSANKIAGRTGNACVWSDDFGARSGGGRPGLNREGGREAWLRPVWSRAGLGKRRRGLLETEG
jgi:hypothetical protein